MIEKNPNNKLRVFYFLIINIFMENESENLDELKEKLKKLNEKKDYVLKALKMIDSQRASLWSRITAHKDF